MRSCSAIRASPQEIDVALFNRVGDLQVKQGKRRGSRHVREAVDAYAEAGGSFNIAMRC